MCHHVEEQCLLEAECSKFKKIAQKTGDFMFKVETTLQVMHHEACRLQSCIIIPYGG
jgi:hypothetical protein